MKNKIIPISLTLLGLALFFIFGVASGSSDEEEDTSPIDMELALEQMDTMETRITTISDMLWDNYIDNSWNSDTLEGFDCMKEETIVKDLKEMKEKWGSRGKELPITYFPRLLTETGYEHEYEINSWDDWDYLESTPIENLYLQDFGAKVDTGLGYRTWIKKDLPRLTQTTYLGVIMPLSADDAYVPEMMKNKNEFYMGWFDGYFMVINLKTTEIACVKRFQVESSDEVDTGGVFADEDRKLWKDFKKHFKKSLKKTAGDIKLDMDIF